MTFIVCGYNDFFFRRGIDMIDDKFNMNELDDLCGFWEKVFSNNSPSLGGLLLLSGPGSFSALTVWPIINLKLIRDYGLYKKSYMLFSPQNKAEFKTPPSWKVSSSVVQAAKQEISFRQQKNYLLDLLLQEFDNLEDDSSVVIVMDNSYCWENDPDWKPERTLIGATSILEVSSPETCFAMRIFQLCRKLISIIKKKNLFVIIGTQCLCTKLPDDLNSIPELGHIQCGWDGESTNYTALIENLVTLHGCPYAIQHISSLQLDDIQKNRLTVLAYYFAGQYQQALMFMRENIAQYENIDNAFAGLQLAQLVNDETVILEFSKYIVDNLPLDFDKLKICISLGLEQNNATLFESSLKLLEQLYPGHSDIARFKFDNYFFNDNYAEALSCAEQLGDEFRVTLCNILLSEVSTWGMQVHNYTGPSKSRLSLSIGRKCCQLDDINQAYQIIKENEFEDGELRKKRILLLMEMYKKDYLLSKTSAQYKSELDKNYFFSEVTEYISRNPEDRETRQHWRDFLADVYDKWLSLRLMVQYVFSYAQKIPKAFETQSLKLCLQSNNEKIVIEDILSENYAPNSQRIIFQDTSMPPNYSYNVEELASILYKSLSFLDLDRGINTLFLLLDLLHRSSFHLGVHNDIFACYDAVAYLRRKHLFQEAKNLSETALLFMPRRENRREDLLRDVLKWEMFAMAFHSSNNNIDSLLHISYAVCIMKEHLSPPKDLWLQLIRNITLILRSNQLYSLALALVEIEESLTEDVTKRKELVQVRYSCLIPELLQSQNNERLIEIFIDIDQYLNKESDKVPFVSLQTTIWGYLTNDDRQKIPPIIQDVFLKNMQLNMGSSGTLLESFLEQEIDVQMLLNRILSIAPCISLDDLRMQLSSWGPFLHQSIVCACKKQNIDLFLIASELEANPFVSLKQIKSTDESRLFERMSQELAQNKDLQKNKTIQQQFIELGKKNLPRYDFSFLQNINFNAVVDVLTPEEIVICFAWDRQDDLNYCTLTKNNGFEIRKLAAHWKGVPSEWSKQRKFACDEQDIGLIARLGKDLLLPLPQDASVKRCYLLPPVNLFGFPLSFLTPKDNRVNINIIPSLEWFIQNRKRIKEECTENIVWLGSLETSDATLEELRPKIIDTLIQKNFITSEEDKPTGCSKKKTAIIACHGDFIESMTLTDGESVFLASDFSSYFRETEVVIMFVCNAGTSTYNALWNDIDSMAEKLLANNVSCVIAPTFPITLETVTAWLERFFIYARHGVSQAASMASQIMRHQNEYKMGWGNLQIYGDGNITIEY